MANVNWSIKNTQGTPAGNSSVDEDQMMRVPHSIDPSETKRAGDMIAGDCFWFGRNIVYVIAEVLENNA